MVRKIKTTRKSRLKGGKYVGEGSYGCGYVPPLRCEGETQREPGTFSKLMEDSEAEKEYKLGDLFRPINSTQKYFLYPHKICPINRTVLPNPENNVDKCQGKFSSLDNALILQYKNGGETLDKLVLNQKDYGPFFLSLVQLLEGLALLHAGNAAHMDIKAENIVFLRESPDIYNIRYIDFGLSLKTNVSDRTDDDVYLSDYFAWPFDTRFIVKNIGKAQITKPKVESYLDKQDYDVSFYPFEIYYDRSHNYIMNVSKYKQIFDAIERAYSSRRRWLKVLAPKTDVYSLGRVLSKLYAKNIGHYYRFDEIIVVNPSDKTKKMKLADLETLVTPEEFAWHNEVATKISVPFFKMIKAMMDVNPITRLTSAEALTQYKTLLEPISNLFTNAKIRLGLGIYYPAFRTAPLTPPPPPQAQPQASFPFLPESPNTPESPHSPQSPFYKLQSPTTPYFPRPPPLPGSTSFIKRFEQSPDTPNTPLGINIISNSYVSPLTPVNENNFYNLSPNIPNNMGRPPLHPPKKRKTRKLRL